MFSLNYHPRATKFLDKIPLKLSRGVVKKLDVLQNDPFSKQLNISPLKGAKSSWRLRVGNIRVVYEVDKESKTIYVQDIDFRGSIY